MMTATQENFKKTEIGLLQSLSALIVAVVCVLAVSPRGMALVQDATTARTLKPRNELTVPLNGGDRETFSVALASRQYAEFRVEQHGSVLLVSLFDPQHKLVLEMDNPAGGHGPILFSFIATQSGNYRVEVNSRDKWANPAEFDIVVDVRSATPEDQRIVEAHREFAEGRGYLRNRNPTAALTSFKNSMSLWTAAENRRWQALTHFALSQTYAAIDVRERPKAIKELEAALQILNEQTPANDWRLKASVLNDLGAYKTSAGEIERGISLLNEALNLYTLRQDRRGQASSLNNLAIAQGRLGNYSLAQEFVQKALPLRQAENDRVGAIHLINSLGGIADGLGEPDRALEFLSQALQEWEKLGEPSADDRRRIAIVLNNLAAVNDKIGRWEKARENYDRALSMLSEGDPVRIATLDNKGELYASLGEVRKARECYNEALRLMPAENFDPDTKAGILVHLGQLLSLEGNTSESVGTFEQARALRPGPRRLADVLTNLGTALASQGQLESAVKAYEEALALQQASKDIRGQALTLQRRGEARDRLKKAEAVDDLKQALDLWKAVKDVRGTAATLNALARLEQGRSHLAEALAYSDEAIAVVESQRMSLSSREVRTSYFATQENYFALNIDLHMQLSGSTSETRYLTRAFEANEKSRARTLLEALQEIGVGRANDEQQSDQQLKNLLQRRNDLTKKLAIKAEARTKLLTSNPKAVQIAVLDKEVDSLTEQCDALDAELRSHNQRFATLNHPRPATLTEIQRLLDDETLLLEYSLGNKRSYAWVVTGDSIRGFELPPSSEIESAANRMGEAINLANQNVKNETSLQERARRAKADAEYTDAARALSGLVIDPFAARLDRKRVVVVPDGALQKVSFVSLSKKSTTALAAEQRSQEPGTGPLILDHEIVVLPSASVVGIIRQQIASRKEAPLPVIVLANPVFGADDDRVQSSRSSRVARGDRSLTPDDDNSGVSETRASSSGKTARVAALRSVESTEISPLPFSSIEAQNILRATKGQGVAKLDFDASRNLALSPEMSRYRLIHFATHGVVDLERPALSRIILSLVDRNGRPQDGYLFLQDIYNLNLPAELVVLSACQTGVGKQVKGEGLIALTRGFMYAGAARLVASYWDVDDAATAELMAQFYKEMFTNGKRPAEALRLAQLHLRKQKRYSSPNYWAGFFIQGEWK